MLSTKLLKLSGTVPMESPRSDGSVSPRARMVASDTATPVKTDSKMLFEQLAQNRRARNANCRSVDLASSDLMNVGNLKEGLFKNGYLYFMLSVR